MLRRILITLVICFVIAGWRGLEAANIRLDTDRHILVLEGPIVKGDYERVLNSIRANDGNWLQYVWSLNSPGGDVDEAMRIGRLFKELYIQTQVLDSNDEAKCASACFLIYIGGVIRDAFANELGVHRPTFSAAEFAAMSPALAEERYKEMVDLVRRYLKEFEVPENVVAKIFMRDSRDIYWLNQQEVDQLGRKPVWLEQYILASCGFTEKMLKAIIRKDRQKARQWALCEANILYTEGRRALSENYINNNRR